MELLFLLVKLCAHLRRASWSTFSSFWHQCNCLCAEGGSYGRYSGRAPPSWKVLRGNGRLRPPSEFVAGLTFKLEKCWVLQTAAQAAILYSCGSQSPLRELGALQVFSVAGQRQQMRSPGSCCYPRWNAFASTFRCGWTSENWKWMQSHFKLTLQSREPYMGCPGLHTPLIPLDSITVRGETEKSSLTQDRSAIELLISFTSIFLLFFPFLDSFFTSCVFNTIVFS